MSDDSHPDIDITTIGTGCATGFGAGCLQVILLTTLVAASGVQIAHATPDSIPVAVKFVGFVSGLGVSVLIGYVTARKAPHSKMLHTIIVAALALILAIAAVAFNPKMYAGNPFSIPAFLLSIPATLLGAYWFISSSKKSQ